MADGTLFDFPSETKRCSRCGEDKPTSLFSKRRGRPHGYCRPCQKEAAREYYMRNIDVVKARARAWKKANPERARALDKASHSRPHVRARKNEQSAEYRRLNAERRKESYTRSYYKHKAKREAASKAWIERNPIWVRERGRRLKIMRKRAEVAWADPAAMRAFYDEAAKLTLITGIPHEVDHIIPIAGENVCGLHCEANLRVVTRMVNRRKRNFLDV